MLIYWFDAWTEAWPWTALLAACYVGLVSWERFVRTNTVRQSELAWWPIRFPSRPRPHPASAGTFESLAKRLRTSPNAQNCYRFLTKKALPVTSFILALLILLGVGYRLILHIPAAEAGICVQASDETAYDFGDPIPFQTKDPCLATGLTLFAGQTYKIAIDVAEPWRDKEFHASPAGFESWLTQFHPVFLAGIPTKRILTYPWFTMIGEISGDPGEIYPVREDITIKPTSTGELRFYVNDAVYSLGGRDDEGHPLNWALLYDNNEGKATITVSRR